MTAADCPDRSVYVTTPIYYVNDRPHVGHVYTTVVADCLARLMRLAGRGVTFRTGTDEHAEKVVESASSRGVTPLEWADTNAAAFRSAFAAVGSSHDDFIRTSEGRHVDHVSSRIGALTASGDVYLGDYEGWYDPSQEEYVTEHAAREHGFTSPVTGRPLEKRSEKNWFFRLSAYADRLRAHIEAHPSFVMPEARRNEVLGRLGSGLSDVPISRAIKAGSADWGIRMPGDADHRVYVWIDALLNYATPMPDGGPVCWPADVHLIAKDILWFHAVIWPSMLMALGEPLPARVYAHSFWIREGRKMSKSLGNFLDWPTLEAYMERYGLDALRWYLIAEGPMGATDADFVHGTFVEVYNAVLANGIGNASSRVTNMLVKYFDGELPVGARGAGDGEPSVVERAAEGIAGRVLAAAEVVDVAGAMSEAVSLSDAVDGYIAETRPFSLMKDPTPEATARVGRILYDCAEALRIAAVVLSPAMPGSMGVLLGRLGQPGPDAKGCFGSDLTELASWGVLRVGGRVEKGEALFPRADPAEAAPVAPGASAGAAG